MKEGIYLLGEDLMADLDHRLIKRGRRNKGYRALKVEYTERGYVVTDRETEERYLLVSYETDPLRQLDIIWAIQMERYMQEMREKEEKEKKR